MPRPYCSGQRIACQQHCRQSSRGCGPGAQALNTIPRERAEWILWLDMDMVLEDVTFTCRWPATRGRDLVMWGQPDWIMRGDNARGVASGIAHANCCKFQLHTMKAMLILPGKPPHPLHACKITLVGAT